MKFTFKVTLMALAMGAIFLWAHNARAQSGDTLLIPWANQSGLVNVDTLYKAIIADTNANGSRKDLNRVYLLQTGGEYWNDQTIKNQDSKGNAFTLRLVGQTPDPTNMLGNPPTLQLLSTNGASHIMQGYGDVYFKNLYVIGCDEKGSQSAYYQTIEFESPNTNCVFDNCIFERDNFGCVAWTTKNNNVTFTNCEFRNLVEFPMTQEWTGRGFSEWADEDSTIVENCTFFNVGCFAIQIEGGSAKYLRFNHNTLVDVGHSMHSGGGGAWWWEAYFTNSLFINTFWHGEGYLEYSPILNPTRDPRAYTSGMIQVAALPGVYGPPIGRRIGIANDAAYLGTYFKTQYGDTVRAQWFINAVTDSFFNTYSPANGGQMVIKDTTWLSAYPKFPAAVIDSLNTLAPVQWTSIVDVRTATANPPSYFYDYPADPTYPTWPIPENFTYTDASLMTAGTDGLPLGDLNWFPTQKASFEANMAHDIATVTATAGKQTVFKVDSVLAASTGTLGGTAVVQPVAGFVDYYFNGGGDIKWTFSLPSAVTGATLRVYVNCNGNSQKGQNLIVNGNYIADHPSQYGQLMFDSPPLALNAWDSLDVTSKDSTNGAAWSATFPAGTNTVEIANSWGWDKFSGVEILDNTGKVVVNLGIAVAQYSSGTLEVSGARWVPTGLKYVAMGTGGTITFAPTVAAGTYLLDVFDQTLTKGATLQATVDGSAITIPSVSTIDTAGGEQLSSTFTFAQPGSHTIELTGANINVDKVQLTASETVTGVRTPSGTANKFALEQNYPNPFNPSTEINYSVPQRSLVTLTVYNVLGQRVAILFSGYQSPGDYQVKFDASKYASGVYFYRLQAGSLNMTRKMMLIK